MCLIPVRGSNKAPNMGRFLEYLYPEPAYKEFTISGNFIAVTNEEKGPDNYDNIIVAFPYVKNLTENPRGIWCQLW